MSIGIPIKLLHEALGHIVSVELKNGAVLRGSLLDAEDNMNLQLKGAVLTQRDGRISQSDHVYIRGSQVRFIVVPDLLKYAPMFEKAGSSANRGRGIGIGHGNADLAAGNPLAKSRGGKMPQSGRSMPINIPGNAGMRNR